MEMIFPGLGSIQYLNHPGCLEKSGLVDKMYFRTN